MAGGLFAVYRDTGAPQSSHAASRRAGGGPTPSSSNNNNNNIRQKGAFAVLRDTPKLNEKENLDPVARPIGKLGKGIVHKKAHPIPVAADCNASRGAFGHKSVQRSHNAPTVVSANGICTGTLKTRVLPPLPPLEEPPVAARSVDRARLVSPVAPSRIGTTSPVRATGVGRSEARDSPASNVDSGYGRASDCDDRSIDTAEEVQGATFDDESDMSIEVDTNELNRRARALTESPLAEVSIQSSFSSFEGWTGTIPHTKSRLDISRLADHASFHGTGTILKQLARIAVAAFNDDGGGAVSLADADRQEDEEDLLTVEVNACAAALEVETVLDDSDDSESETGPNGA